MFSAIASFFRKIGYLLTGKVDNASRGLAKNPQVIQATFDRVITEKKSRINQYKDAVARMIAQEEGKLAKIKDLSEEINKLGKLREGAAAKARQVVQWLKGEGKSEAEIKGNADYQKCLAAYNDFSSTLKEKEVHVVDLEGEVKEVQGTIGHHKVQLQSLLREIDKLKQEGNETVADVITAREEQQINEMLAGVSQDRTGRELEEMRAIRNESKANARISREMAGTDSKVLENEFLEYATSSESTDEFDQLIGLGRTADKAESPSAEKPSQEAKLPEL